MTELLDKDTDLPLSAGEDDMRQFLREIRTFPRLTAEEEKELARRCAEGDEDAIRQMVNSNLRLVVSIAREYAGRGVALMDLIQEGSIGQLSRSVAVYYPAGIISLAIVQSREVLVNILAESLWSYKVHRSSGHSLALAQRD